MEQLTLIPVEKDQAVLDEVGKLLEMLPEWMIFGAWDTSRCPVCKGWKKKDSMGRFNHGHTVKCPRKKLQDAF
jgi:hypothetical protein